MLLNVPISQWYKTEMLYILSDVIKLDCAPFKICPSGIGINFVTKVDVTLQRFTLHALMSSPEQL